MRSLFTRWSKTDGERLHHRVVVCTLRVCVARPLKTDIDHACLPVQKVCFASFLVVNHGDIHTVCEQSRELTATVKSVFLDSLLVANHGDIHTVCWQSRELIIAI